MIRYLLQLSYFEEAHAVNVAQRICAATKHLASQHLGQMQGAMCSRYL